MYVVIKKDITILILPLNLLHQIANSYMKFMAEGCAPDSCVLGLAITRGTPFKKSWVHPGLLSVAN